MKQLNLIYLNIMFYNIGPKGRELIVRALYLRRKSRYFRLSGNKIKNIGGMFLLECYKLIHLREVF